MDMLNSVEVGDRCVPHDVIANIWHCKLSTAVAVDGACVHKQERRFVGCWLNDFSMLNICIFEKQTIARGFIWYQYNGFGVN